MTNCGLDYGNASYRGIEFEILPVANTGGRRVLTHEYPFTDLHFNEDLGAKPERWTVRGAFIGEDHRDKLQIAKRVWTAAGNGLFYEPTENRTHNVTLVDWTYDYNDRSLNRVEFSLDFVARADDPYPSGALNSILAQLNNTITQFITSWSNVYSNQMALFTEFQDVLTGLRGAAATVTGSLFQTASGVIGFASDTARQTLGIGSYNSARAAINAATPAKVAQTNIDNSLAIYEAALPGGQSFPRQMSEVRLVGNAETQAQALLYAGFGLAYYLRSLEEGANYFEVEQFRDRALDLKEAVQDAGFTRENELLALNAIDSLIAVAGGLAEDQCLTVETGQHHALVASYRLYGSVSEAFELLERSGGVAGARLTTLTRPCVVSNG